MIPSVIKSRVAFNAIRYYAALSYLYYELDYSAVEDHEFDELCKWLLENYSWVKKHDMNGYLNRARLKEGTGYHLNGKVIGQTKDFALAIKKENEDFSDLA